MADTDPLVRIVALDLPRQPEVTARFQPQNLVIDKAVPWMQSPTSMGDLPELQHSAALGRVLKVELVFDGTAGATGVQPKLDLLSRMARHINDAGAEDKKRPSMVALHFPGEKIPEFRGGIESLSIRYLELLPDGAPSRATVELHVREASRLSFRKPK